MRSHVSFFVFTKSIISKPTTYGTSTSMFLVTILLIKKEKKKRNFERKNNFGLICLLIIVRCTQMETPSHFYRFFSFRNIIWLLRARFEKACVERLRSFECIDIQPENVKIFT